MSEPSVHISQFLNQNEPLPALFKYRMSDFIVEEVGEDKNIITHNPNYMDELKKMQEKQILLDCDKSAEEVLIKYILEEQQQNDLKQLFQQPENFIRNNKNYKFQLQVLNLDKNERRIIHQTIREKLQGFESKTTNEGNGIEFWYTGKVQFKKWLYFHLRKRNYDTMSAIRRLAMMLKKSNGNFYFAGTKDQRAETVQRITVKNTSKQKFANTFLKNQKWNFDELSFSNFEYKDDNISLGSLYGNRFTIALRNNKTFDEKNIEQRVQQVRKEGFINYFGQQRFGTKQGVIQQVQDMGDWKIFNKKAIQRSILFCS